MFYQGLENKKFRLWEFSKQDELEFAKGYQYQHDDSECPRPRIELMPDETKTLGEEEFDSILLKRDSSKLIYVELENLKLEWPKEESILIFIKYYNIDKLLTEYKVFIFSVKGFLIKLFVKGNIAFVDAKIAFFATFIDKTNR